MHTGVDILTQAKVATKFIPQQNVAKTQRFLHRISDLDHPNILGYQVVKDNEKVWLVSPLADDNLSCIIDHCKRDNKVLPFAQLLDTALQIV